MRWPWLLLLAAGLVACGQQAEEKKSGGPPPTLVTATQVQRGAIDVSEETLGTLESAHDPKVAAEVAGKVVKVLAFAGQAVKAGALLAVIDPGDAALQQRADEAEAHRLQLLEERQLALVAKGFLSKSAGENATAQRDVARARADLSQRSLGKTRVTAPHDGIVESQLVAPGDYVKLGDAMFQLVANAGLRAHLPFPESAAPRLARGQTVVLTSPLLPGQSIEAPIAEIRPMVDAGSRALDVIVDLARVKGVEALRAGGTVNAAVRIATKEAALLVPEQSVVLRPAGKVVYAIVEAGDRKKAVQRVVQVGAKRKGMVEILDGLAAGDSVVLDGAGFLTDGASIGIKEPAQAKPATKPQAQ